MKNNVAVLLMCTTTIIMVMGIAWGVVSYWNDNISRQNYERETLTIDDTCRYDLNGRGHYETRDFTADGKTTKIVQFICDYTKK